MLCWIFPLSNWRLNLPTLHWWICIKLNPSFRIWEECVVHGNVTFLRVYTLSVW